MFSDLFFGPRPAWAASSGPRGGWQPWAEGDAWGDPDDAASTSESWGERPWGGRPWAPPFESPLGRKMWRMARRFAFGPGPFQPGPFGPRPGPRMFGRGDLKYALLRLLADRPKHGYEMIKELQDLSGGFYTPSAGAIYPTLQLLEDRGWVTSEMVAGKKVYSISDEGRRALAERPEPEPGGAGPRHGPRGWEGWGPGPHGHHGPFARQVRPELHALMHESREVAHLMRHAAMTSGGDPARLARLRAIVERTRADMQALIEARDVPGGDAGDGGEVI